MKDLNDPTLSEELLQRYKDEGADPEEILRVYLSLWRELSVASLDIAKSAEALIEMVKEHPAHLVPEAHSRLLVTIDWTHHAAHLRALYEAVRRRRLTDAVNQAMEDLGIVDVEEDDATPAQRMAMMRRVSEIMGEQIDIPPAGSSVH